MLLKINQLFCISVPEEFINGYHFGDMFMAYPIGFNVGTYAILRHSGMMTKGNETIFRLLDVGILGNKKFKSEDYRHSLFTGYTLLYPQSQHLTSSCIVTSRSTKSFIL